jgi:hypothetical protein
MTVVSPILPRPYTLFSRNGCRWGMYAMVEALARICVRLMRLLFVWLVFLSLLNHRIFSYCLSVGQA